VAITSPASGQTVGGTINVTADASDNVGVVGVEFRVDGALGPEDTSAPYAVAWDTTTATNGSHTLTAIARDAAGNRTTSAPVTVTVSNSSTTPQCSTSLDAFPGSTTFNNTVRTQMWFIDTTWWGVFSDASTGIYFYKLVGSTFVKGDFVDPSFAAGKPDVLWNGSQLFVMVEQSSSLAKLYKYSYSSASQSFALMTGFPVDLPLSGATTVGVVNAVPIHQDSTGKLWAAYAADTNVHVIWSTSADHRTWDTTGFVLASDVSNLTTEAAAIAAFGGNKIGVVWGNQNLAEWAFKFHRDGDPENVWSAKEIIDCCGTSGSVADDHVSLRAAPDGRLFAVLKDSVGAGHLHLYVRSVAGVWGQKTDVDPDPNAQPTRPQLVLDVEAGLAFVLYHNSTVKIVYMTRSSMSSPGFAPRCVFLPQGNNVTSTKQNVTSATGLVAADSTNTSQILPARFDLTGLSGATSMTMTSGTGSEGPAAVWAAPQPASLLASTAAGGSLQEGPTIAGFEPVWTGRLSMSETPADASQWWQLRGQGANTIVNLDAVMYDFAQYGFESFLWMPMAAGAVPTDQQATSFLKFIQLCDNEPAHLSGGARDARATLVALLRYAIDGWTIEAALAEGERVNAGIALSPEQVTWLQGWAASHPSGSEQLGSCSTQ